MSNWNKWKSQGGKWLLLLAAAASLQGCGVELIAGGAALGGVAAVDRRTVGAQTDDKTIMVKAEMRASEVVGDKGHVNVTSYNRKVLLTGEVFNQQLKDAVENKVKQIPSVQSVVNELDINVASGFASRSNDSYITSKVLASIIDAKDVYSSSLKVVTERGIVYLMGRVTQREGDRAAQIASSISGVTRVVKVFEYISEEELKQLMGSTPKEQSATEPRNAPITEAGSGAGSDASRDAPAEVSTTPVRQP